MAMFRVKVRRETHDELEFLVRAPDLQHFKNVTDDDLYEAGDSLLGLDEWDIVENDISVNIKEVTTDESPLLVLGEELEEYKPPPPPDPRQIDLPGMEKEQ